MSIETTPSSAPDPEWQQLVDGYFNVPGTGPVEKQATSVDLMGDTPLVPAWTRSGEGWKNRAEVGRVNTVRGFRRWLRRQASEHGHASQIGRGVQRAFLWVQGTEGAQVTAARHEVQQAQRDYKTAKWAHDRRLVPGKEKEKRRREMEATFTDSVSAMSRYRSAQRDARTRRVVRGVAALGPVVGVEGVGVTFLGAPGGLAATAATLTALALLGRRTTAGELYTDRDATIGDGDRMTDEMLNRVYQDARVIPADAVLKLRTPCTIAADGSAWEVEFDLPSGTPTAKATGAVSALASGFGVTVQQVSQTAGDREGRIRLRVSLKVPFTGKPVRGPLLDCERCDLWDKVPMGISERGETITTEWFEKTALFGGEPGSGKTSMANGLMLAASLDPTARIFGADGKAGADLLPYEDIAEMIDTEGDPEALLEILRHVWTMVLPECKQVAREHGARRFSRALAAKDPRVRFTVLAIDEWASYLGSADPKTAKEIDRLLRLIVQQGRAYGVIVLASTQKPDSEAVPTGVRDIISTRWAGRCLTPEASDTILGKGRAASGHNAQRIQKQQRGVGLYQTGESADPVLMRAYYYDDGEKSGVDEVDLILKRAYRLRAEAGTLPAASLPVLTVLDHLIAAAEATDRGCVTREEVRAYMADIDDRYAQRDDEDDRAYAGRASKLLADDLEQAGVSVPEKKVDKAEGGRSMGYRLEDLIAAR